MEDVVVFGFTHGLHSEGYSREILEFLRSAGKEINEWVKEGKKVAIIKETVGMEPQTIRSFLESLINVSTSVKDIERNFKEGIKCIVPLLKLPDGECTLVSDTIKLSDRFFQNLNAIKFPQEKGDKIYVALESAILSNESGEIRKEFKDYLKDIRSVLKKFYPEIQYFSESTGCNLLRLDSPFLTTSTSLPKHGYLPLPQPLFSLLLFLNFYYREENFKSQVKELKKLGYDTIALIVGNAHGCWAKKRRNMKIYGRELKEDLEIIPRLYKYGVKPTSLLNDERKLEDLSFRAGEVMNISYYIVRRKEPFLFYGNDVESYFERGFRVLETCHKLLELLEEKPELYEELKEMYDERVSKVLKNKGLEDLRFYDLKSLDWKEEEKFLEKAYEKLKPYF